MNARFKEILKRTPTEPGVYLMRTTTGKIFYVGKAANLRSRLRSYFSNADKRPFVKRLPRILGDVETFITRNEKEALLLENRLIKTHQPRFNIKLRDDKNFLSLRIDVRAQWPRVEVVRRQRRDGGEYFGPYHCATSIRQTLGILNKYFGLRTCKDSVLHNRSRPCLQYQIKRCPAPCVFDISRDEYRRSVGETILFLQGRHTELISSLQDRMEQAATRWEYELAAGYRDQIHDIKNSLTGQQVETIRSIDQDALGLYREGDLLSVEVLNIRRGVLSGHRRFVFSEQEQPDEEILTSFIVQFYSGHFTVPHEVLVPLSLPSAALLAEVLTEQQGRQVKVIHPRRGAKRSLVEAAVRNAQQAFNEELGIVERRRKELSKLQKKLHLTNLPRRIECFDIANLGNEAIVGSMVVFVDGEPDKSSYRAFRVRTVATQDDFASLVEVLSRRVKRSQQGDEPWPDLMIVDGGKGQLNRVLGAFEELGVHDLELVGLAKSRLKPTETESEHVARTDERVYLPGAKSPIRLKPNTAERHLMERVRDEAHRFANAYSRKLREKRALGSSLERIPGIGAVRRRALIKHFGSVGRIKCATVDELAEVEGFSFGLAARVFRHIGRPDS